MDDASVISTGVNLLATALAAISGLIYNYSEDGKKLHVSHKCGAAVAKLFEEDDPLRQGAHGERLIKRAIKVAEQEENEKKKTSGGGHGSGRSSIRG